MLETMKHSRWTTVVVIVALAALSGCAGRSLTESQCLAGDWETVGHRDGSRGLDASQLLEHQNACVRHGVVPDRDLYLRGWAEGVRRFCTPANGFTRGERGNEYPRVCPHELEPAFQDAWRDGRALYLARYDLRRIENLLSSRQAELEDIDATLADIAVRIATDPNATAADRIAWVNESVKLARTRVQIEAEIDSLLVDLDVQRLRVDDLSQQLAGRY
jgi:hypothetical protein